MSISFHSENDTFDFTSLNQLAMVLGGFFGWMAEVSWLGWMWVDSSFCYRIDGLVGGREFTWIGDRWTLVDHNVLYGVILTRIQKAKSWK
jgi:hypothetical protein